MALDPGSTLLAHLLPRFRPEQLENLATESLAWAVNSSAAARAELEQLVRRTDVDVGPLSWSTQSGGRTGTPDMLGRDGAEDRVLIEAKFWAQLTGNQPLGYLERLHGQGLLLFVAPERRLELLWGQLSLSLSRDGRPIETVEQVGPVRMARVDGVCLAVIPWPALLGRLSDAARSAGDDVVVRGLAELNGVCQRVDNEAFLPIDQAELSPELARRMMDLRELVDSIAQRLVSEKRSSARGFRRTPRFDEYRTYSRFHGWHGFIALSFRLWRDHGHPLWFGLWRYPDLSGDIARDCLAPLRQDFPGEPVPEDGENYLSVPLLVATGLDRDGTLNHLLVQAHRITDRVIQFKTDHPEIALDGGSAPVPTETLADEASDVGGLESP